MNLSKIIKRGYLSSDWFEDVPVKITNANFEKQELMSIDEIPVLPEVRSFTFVAELDESSPISYYDLKGQIIKVELFVDGPHGYSLMMDCVEIGYENMLKIMFSSSGGINVRLPK